MPVKVQPFDSRQSMRQKSYEVFHYRDKKPENVGVHHHDFFEVYFFLSGQVDFRVEGKTCHLEPGDLLLINPWELHQPQIGPDTLYERIVLWIDCGYLAELGREGMDLCACFRRGTNLLRPSKGHRAMLSALLENLTWEFYSQKPGSSLYAKGLLLQFMVEVNRLMLDAAPPEISAEQDLVSQVVDYIGSHYRDEITLDALAEAFYVSKYHLSHEFTHRVGTSVYRYILFRRLMAARELLASGQAPGQVYLLCGFRDYTNFYRAFKEEYGMSPKAFAQENRRPEG